MGLKTSMLFAFVHVAALLLCFIVCTGAQSSTTLGSTLGNDPGDDNSTTSNPDTSKPESSNVAVTIVVVVLVVAVVVAVIIFVLLRLRKRRMADYEKKTKIQMSSTGNAGVYVDLSAAPQDDKEKQPESPETEHLNKEDD